MSAEPTADEHNPFGPIGPEPDAVPADLHRAAARLFAAGVTVVASRHEGLTHAITATAFCSLSLDPPLVLVAVGRDGQMHRHAATAGHFGVSVLSEAQRPVADWAAVPHRLPLAEIPVASFTARTGAPLMQGAVAWFDCTLENTSDHGDHTLLIGRVVGAWAVPERQPLVYFDGSYRHFIKDA